MTKKELVNRIAEEMNLDQVMTRDVVQRTLDLILETLAKHGRIELRNFGVFEVKTRAARKARNPKTNTELLVPPRSVLCFQPGKNVSALIERAHPPRPPSPA